MKFRSLFILFIMMLLVFFAAIVFLPYIMLGFSFAGSFWRLNWPSIFVLALFFLSVIVYYFTNRRLFMLLEREDWPALVCYLENRVISKGRYSSRLVRLLANTYLLLSDSEAVKNLENKVSIAKPGLVNANVLIFGTARILGNDIPGVLKFFQARKDKVKPAKREWVNWYYSFASLLNRQYEEAAAGFSLLADESGDGVIAALSSYFLSETMIRFLPGNEQKFESISTRGKERVLKSLPRIEHWNREISRLSTEIHIAAISGYMEETGRWLYKDGS